jgi:Ca2+-transporting ATPase
MIGTFCIFVHGLIEYDLIKARSLAFTTMAMYQVFNSLNCRSRTKSVFELGFFSNKYLLVAIIASVILQIGAIYIPFFNIILGTTPFTINEWLLIVLVASSVFFGDELRKLIRKIVLRRKN